jgi:hypothetical protein
MLVVCGSVVLSHTKPLTPGQVGVAHDTMIMVLFQETLFCKLPGHAHQVSISLRHLIMIITDHSLSPCVIQTFMSKILQK